MSFVIVIIYFDMDDNKFILPHRAYRKFPNIGKFYLVKFLLLVIPFEVFVLLFYKDITLFMCKMIGLYFSKFSDVKILNIDGILKNLYIVDLVGKFPSYSYSFVVLVFSIFALFLVRLIKTKPIQLWIIYILSLVIVSSLFFIMFPSKFPYDIKTFSELYMNTQIGIWLTSPVIISMAITPIPSSLFSKFLVVLLTFAYSLLFGVLRYYVFIYILVKFSYLFAPVIYFVLGPLIDFAYIVGIYSLYTGIIARRLKENREAWRWLF